jgi:hypothetical protein
MKKQVQTKILNATQNEGMTNSLNKCAHSISEATSGHYSRIYDTKGMSGELQGRSEGMEQESSLLSFSVKVGGKRSKHICNTSILILIPFLYLCRTELS